MMWPMRGLFIFLAFAIPIVLVNPLFWSIVNMNAGAERIGYVRANGVTQWATIGPRSVWPDWALTPAGARVTVQSHFEAAPGESARGVADFETDDAPRLVQAAYAQAAEAAGWTVELSQLRTLSPDLPPQPLHLCFVQARREGRSLTLSVQDENGHSAGTVHWADGDTPSMRGATPGAC